MKNNFTRARVQLTAWYLVILMIVAFIFSIVVYTSLNSELLRGARREQQKIVADRLRIELPKPLPDPKDLQRELVDPPLDDNIREDYIISRNQLLLSLFLANLIVLGVSASASYLLAGKTLKPIEKMLEDQKIFVASASHELRTPLANLKTALEVTLMMGPIPYKKIKDLLESNLEDVNTLEKLANSLLLVEKFSNDIDRNSFQEVRLDKIILDSVSRFTKQADKKKISIKHQLEQVVLVGNEEALREMVDNLLENSIKYNKDKGKIYINLTSNNNHLTFTIKDTGIGIEKNDFNKIFERFYRADNSRSKTITKGYGLGLSIVNEIIKQHHGQILVESTINMGTTFVINLPLKRS